jgi:hypothetical protein
MATTRRRTSLKWPTARLRTRLSNTKSFCWPWYLSTVAICARGRQDRGKGGRAGGRAGRVGAGEGAALASSAAWLGAATAAGALRCAARPDGRRPRLSLQAPLAPLLPAAQHRRKEPAAESRATAASPAPAPVGSQAAEAGRLHRALHAPPAGVSVCAVNVWIICVSVFVNVCVCGVSGKRSRWRTHPPGGAAQRWGCRRIAAPRRRV